MYIFNATTNHLGERRLEIRSDNDCGPVAYLPFTMVYALLNNADTVRATMEGKFSTIGAVRDAYKARRIMFTAAIRHVRNILKTDLQTAREVVEGWEV